MLLVTTAVFLLHCRTAATALYDHFPSRELMQQENENFESLRKREKHALLSHSLSQQTQHEEWSNVPHFWRGRRDLFLADDSDGQEQVSNVSSSSVSPTIVTPETSGNTNGDIQVSFLKEIFPGPGNHSDLRVWPTANDFFGYTLFAANDGVHGRETWVTDGTANGTMLLKDFHPGPEDGNSVSVSDDFFVNTNVTGEDVTFFRVDGIPGMEQVWTTDGTPEGTQLLMNATAILDWTIEPERKEYWFVVKEWGSEEGSSLLRMDFNGTVFPVTIPAGGEVDLDTSVGRSPTAYYELDIALVEDLFYHPTQKTMFVIQDIPGVYNDTSGEKIVDSQATIWSTADGGESFELFLDPSLFTERPCESIIFLSLGPLLRDDYFLVHCSTSDYQRELHLVSYDDPTFVVKLLDGRVGSRFSMEEILLYTASSGNELFRVNVTSGDIDVLVNETETGKYFRGVAGAPQETEENEGKLYYFVQGGNSGDLDAIVNSVLYGQELEWSEAAELWSIDMITLEKELLFVWPGSEFLSAILLSDNRMVVVTETPTEVALWALDSTNDPNVPPQLIHQMNTTLYDDSRYWYPRYAFVDMDQIIWNGYDDEHGQELWSMTWEPRRQPFTN